MIQGKLAGRLFCTISLTAAVSAQTFIVDANNGPGTNYTSIAAATAAVPGGSRLIVRAGTYAEFTIVGKTLTLLCDPGVYVSNPAWWVPAFEISWIGAGQSVTLSGLGLAGAIQSARVHDCVGAVVIEDFSMSPAVSAGFGVGDIWIHDCDQVVVRDSTATEALFWLDHARVVFENCTIHGQDAQLAAGSYSASSHAIHVENSSAEIVDCTLVGGSGNASSFFGWNREAISASGLISEVRVLAPSTITGASGQGLAPAAALGGTGSLRIDPGVVLQSAASPQIAATLVTQTAVMPTVLGQSGAPGGAMSASAIGPIGTVTILVLGLPGPPLALPGVFDEFWLNPAAYAFVAIGTPQLGAPLTGSVAVPSEQGLRGLIFAWQSVAVTGSVLEASNPSWTMVR